MMKLGFFYRLEQDVQEILTEIKKSNYQQLLKFDQLNMEIEANKVFAGFRKSKCCSLSVSESPQVQNKHLMRRSR